MSGVHWGTLGGACLTLALGACGSDDSGTPSTDCIPSGYSTVQLTVGQAQRAYIVYRPTTLSAVQPAPLLVFFHGFGSNAEQQKAFTALDRTAEARGFILVLAESGDGSWLLARADNAEFPYIDALVTDVDRCLNVDLTRVYAAGHSNGAQLVYRLLEYRAATFAGFAAFAGSAFSNVVVQSVSAPTPRAFMWIHGSDDDLFRWEHTIPSFSTRAGARDELARQWTCSSSTISSDQPWQEFTGCRGGVRIRSLLVPNMGHVMWPSPHAILRPPGLAFDANEIMWDFLAAFRR